MITIWIWLSLVIDRLVYINVNKLEPIHILTAIILSIVAIPIDLFLAPIEIVAYIIYNKLTKDSED